MFQAYAWRSLVIPGVCQVLFHIPIACIILFLFRDEYVAIFCQEGGPFQGDGTCAWEAWGPLCAGKWDGTYSWLEISSNNFREFRKQFYIKFGLKHGQLWGLGIFRLELLLVLSQNSLCATAFVSSSFSKSWQTLQSPVLPVRSRVLAGTGTPNSLVTWIVILIFAQCSVSCEFETWNAKRP